MALGGEDQYQSRYFAEQFLNGRARFGMFSLNRNGPATLDEKRRAVIARELADSYAKLNMPREAVAYDRIAVHLDPSDAAAKTQLNSLQALLDRERANRQRRPVITENLEQDHAVRPRLAAAAGAAGGGQ